MKQSSLLPDTHDGMKDGEPVECLGMTFPSDSARREHFLQKLAEQLQDPEFRNIPGFPKGSDEDILALSDPPYYTACPNPFLGEVIASLQKNTSPYDGYKVTPFASDVTEGKSDPIYDAHPYHTKVPPKALMRLLLHYTQPDDVVLDAFSGSGMLGVAASLCESPEKYLSAFDGQPGLRHAVLSDISPLATFIGHNNCWPVISDARFLEEASLIVEECRNSMGWMYKTKHAKGHTATYGDILYTIWSEYYLCSYCDAEFLAWDSIVDRGGQSILKQFNCSDCDGVLKKDRMTRVTEMYFDTLLNAPATRNKATPVLIHYKVGTQRFTKTPDDDDLALLNKIEQTPYPSSVTPTKMNFKDPPWGDFYRPGYHAGMTHVHHFYTKRNLLTLAALRERTTAAEHFRQMLFVLTGFVENHSSKRNRYLIDKHHPTGTTCGPLPNSLYVPELQCEVNPLNTWTKTAKKQAKSFAVTRLGTSISTTEASRFLSIPDNSIDYVFVDPPFGKNILYAESSFCWEQFLKVFEDRTCEAIVSNAQGKGVEEYQLLIRDVFSQCWRVLKPGRWMTIEFSNRSNLVWNAISESVQASGFIIADVRVFDKKQGTIRQDLGQSVNKDLIISAYKPETELEDQFRVDAGTEQGVWDFVRKHLEQLPLFVDCNGSAEVVAERQHLMLFDRMVAFHVQHGVAVPMSASELHTGLEQRFPSRDGMYFLPDQVAEYDKKRMTVKEVLQLQLFVSDEASAIQWLNQQLTKKPQTFQEIHPRFIKEIGGWQKHELALELSELLEQNFLRYDGRAEVPTQIHSYLSTNFKALRNLPKDDPALRETGKDRWYVPDPKKAEDLEKLRERALLREFDEYRESKQRRIKLFRLEAVRAGFKKAWQDRDYPTIIAVAQKIPEKVLQEDPKLLMWYDQAVTRSGDEG